MTLRALIGAQQAQIDEAQRWPLFRCLVVVLCPNCKSNNGVGGVRIRGNAAGELHVGLCPIGSIALCSIYDGRYANAQKQWAEPKRVPLASHRAVVLGSTSTPSSLPFCCDRGHRSTGRTGTLLTLAKTVLADPNQKPKTFIADEMHHPPTPTG